MSQAARRVSFSVKDADTFASLSADLGAKLLFDEVTSDFTLSVQGERLPAHRAILAARSPVFHAMLFAVPMRESSERVVEVAAFTASTMRHLLRYMYTGIIEDVCLEDVIILTACADHYGVLLLRDKICSRLADTMCIDTVCGMLVHAWEYGQEILVGQCCSFIKERASEVVKSNGFVQLSATILMTLLESDDTCIEEIDLFRALVRWSARQPQLPEAQPDAKQVETLFAMIRYGRMTGQELVVEVKPLVSKGLVPRDLYTHAVESVAAPDSFPLDIEVRLSMTHLATGQMREQTLDPIVRSCWVVGRKSTADVLVPNSWGSVSGRHASIEYKDGKWFLRHLGQNGTWLGAARLPSDVPRLWKFGDTARFCKRDVGVELRLRLPCLPPRFSAPRGRKRPYGAA